jgi:hypothetical protein
LHVFSWSKNTWALDWDRKPRLRPWGSHIACMLPQYRTRKDCEEKNLEEGRLTLAWL